MGRRENKKDFRSRPVECIDYDEWWLVCWIAHAATDNYEGGDPPDAPIENIVAFLTRHE